MPRTHTRSTNGSHMPRETVGRDHDTGYRAASSYHFYDSFWAEDKSRELFGDAGDRVAGLFDAHAALAVEKQMIRSRLGGTLREIERKLGTANACREELAAAARELPCLLARLHALRSCAEGWQDIHADDELMTARAESCLARLAILQPGNA